MFEIDTETRKMLQDIGTLFGVKSDIIRDVWEYTVYTWALKLLDDPDKLQAITVPFMGSIALKYDGQEISDQTGKIEDKVITFISLNADFKKLVGDIASGSKTDLADYLKKRCIDRVVDDIEHSS